MLGHGTCLGAYRDGALIEDDHDIDIWIFNSSIEEVRKVIDWDYSKRATRFNQHKFVIDGHIFDVVFWQKRGDEYHLEFWRHSPDRLPARLAETKPFIFLGEEFLIPKYTEEYLEYYYDKDWWIPQNGRSATVRK